LISACLTNIANNGDIRPGTCLQFGEPEFYKQIAKKRVKTFVHHEEQSRFAVEKILRFLRLAIPGR